MNTRASMEWRDGMTACMLTLAVAALLFAWSPSLRPGFVPPRPAPPAIMYCPPALTAGDHQEHYDEWDVTHSPALIALSAAMMLPPAKRSQAKTVTPPLDAAYSLLRFPDTHPVERDDQVPVLTPPRPMTHMAIQRLATSVPPAAQDAIATRQPSPKPASCQVDLIGDWRGRSVDLSPIQALSGYTRPWSFTAILRYDQTGQIQHAIIESAALDQTLRDEVARRLYQCRVSPGDISGEGRLTVSFPGRSSRTVLIPRSPVPADIR
ncbi:MAG: hypothetical protein PHW60_14445 [Kiritimatiellae bacterium]|nr:hypothetical protein [Kiritimatiellia bacterium]